MTGELDGPASYVGLFNAQVRAHKKEVAEALRAVIPITAKYEEMYTETGQLGLINQVGVVARQLADQLDPPQLPQGTADQLQARQV